MPFANQILGGQNKLIRPAIQSPNFSEAAQTGWAIMKNGDAFFYNITATGQITGNTVVVSGAGDGVFVYSGTPGPGTLVVAIAAESGTDQYGNAYSGPGIAVSIPGGAGNIIQVRPDLGALLVYAA